MKKVFFYVSAVVFSLVLTACGSSEEDTTKVEKDVQELEKLMEESMNELDNDLKEMDAVKEEEKSSVTSKTTPKENNYR
jgi:outer membrane murein-binding lipoprotein Lpp